ncbi:MAG: hypothetical protein CV087_11315 [Candidatus Brocadia sp. WS118]|nr:MAG: hypothetical protein CV087_11315 [Candidatus Brocadia sp. WS118]
MFDIDDDPNAQKKVDFIKATNTKFLANGDYYADVDGSGDITKFTQVFDQLKPITVIVTKGNHDDEEDGSQKVKDAMDTYFGWSPIAASKYVSEDGKYAIIGMDTQDDNITKQDGQQYLFVKNTLESDEFKNALYRFVVLHKNLVSAEGKHANLDNVREVYHPLFTQNKVSLVIQAHDHNMALSKLIDGITYIVNGAGGRSHYAIGENPATIEWSNDSTYGLGLIREHKTDANKIQIKFVDFNGKLIHSKVLNFGPVVEPEPEPEPEPCPAGQHRDPVTGQCVPDIVTPPPSGEVLYDSNIDGKWNNGVARTVEDSEGDQSPNGKGLYTAASGNPKLVLDGQGVGTLTCGDGHGRIYIKATNYNCILETEFNILDDTVENFSQKVRSRHQEGGSPENRFGGVGFTIARPNVGHKIEKFHNEHEKGFDEILQKKLELNKWYKSRFTCQDVPDGILQRGEIDYNDGNGYVKVSETVFKNPPAYYVDKNKFMEESYIWLRLNGSGRIAMRNVRLTAI